MSLHTELSPSGDPKMSEDIPLHQETLASVALDGTRISCHVATVVVASDRNLSTEQRMEMLAAMEAAQEALDYARALLPVKTTSVHVAGGRTESGIIIPGL